MITPEGTLHFPKLYEAEDFMGKKAYRAMIVFDKGVTPQSGLEVVVAALEDAVKQTWPDGVPNAVRKSNPLKFDEERGTWFINARRVEDVGPPGVIDTEGRAVSKSSGAMYAGCRVRLALKAHAYDYDGSKGVTLLLEAVQRVGDGEPIMPDPTTRAASLFGVEVQGGASDASAPAGAAAGSAPAPGTPAYNGLFG